MRWYEILINTTEEASDVIIDILKDLNSCGSFIEKINEEDKEVIIKSYFYDYENLTLLISIIKEKLSFISQFLDVGKKDISVFIVHENNWSQIWKEDYNIKNLCSNIIIQPSWDNTIFEDKIIINLNTSISFGDGNHVTTQMCSNLLEKYIKKNDIIFDVGTGSGILSIIAAKLGASKIKAIDISHSACQQALENIKNNNVKENIDVEIGEINKYKNSNFDLIVSNIITDVALSIASEVKNNLKINGIYIVSAINLDRKIEVIDFHKNIGFELIEIKEINNWVSIVFKNK